MTTRTPKPLIDWTTLTTTATDTQYTITTGTKTILGNLTFRNTNSTTARTVTIYLVNTSGTSYVFDTKTIQPGSTWRCYDIQGTTLTYAATNPHKINFIVDAGTDVNVFLSGTEVT